MAFWSGEKLAARVHLLFDPYDSAQIDRNAYVLRMGDRYFKTADQEQADDAHPVRTMLASGEQFAIPPGQFAFLLCRETIKLPKNAMALISMRTPFKFQGLINVSGFHVDPGYEGKLVYAVFNASPSPVRITEGEEAFKIWICDLDHESVPPDSSSPYIATPNDAVNDISSQLLRGMNGPILSLQNLAKKMKEQQQALDTKLAEQKPTIDSLSFVWRAITLAVVGALVVAITVPIFRELWLAYSQKISEWVPLLLRKLGIN
jgi:dCTP deaminase